jgi:hypothetical protein
MSAAAAALARARAAGLRLRLRPDGGLRVEADAPPPAELLDELRQWRDKIASLLAAQDRRPEPGGLVGDDDDPERQAMAAYYSGELSAPSYLPSDRDDYRDGLLLASRMRPPSWTAPTPPPQGAWCSCCGRNNPKAGGRWWRPRHPRTDGLGLGPGWRCWRCHPPPVDSAEVEVVET